tara:strand:+ start:82 stop:1116 length:1035 start_codon:yes stop_codon:yes gene_type:complete
MRLDEFPTVTAIVLAYNGGKDLIICVDSLIKSVYPNLQILVVDNASVDGSVEELRKKFPGVEIVVNQNNFGYAAGNNIGIMRSSDEFIVLINQDAMVSPDWLGHLIDAAKRHKNGAFFQPKILLSSNKPIIDSAGNETHLLGFGFPRGLGEVDRGQYENIRVLGHVSGSCLLIRRTALSTIGLLDPFYFIYNEDTDLCWRGSILGWRSYYVPTSVVYHDHVTSLSESKYYFLERNRLATVLKNYRKNTLVLLLPLLLGVELLMLLLALSRFWLGWKIRGYADLIRARAYLSSARLRIQSSRRLDDRVVMNNFSITFHHLAFRGLSDAANRVFTAYYSFIRKYVR